MDGNRIIWKLYDEALVINVYVLESIEFKLGTKLKKQDYDCEMGPLVNLSDEWSFSFFFFFRNSNE